MFIVAWKLKLLHSLRDSLHPAHHLFELLPSGKRYKSIKTRTTRFVSSFFLPQRHHHTELRTWKITPETHVNTNNQ